VEVVIEYSERDVDVVEVVDLEATVFADAGDEPEFVCVGREGMTREEGDELTITTPETDDDESAVVRSPVLDELQRVTGIDPEDGVDDRVGSREDLVASFTSGYSPLDPTRPDTGSTNSTYRLRINVEPAMLEPTES